MFDDQTIAEAIVGYGIIPVPQILANIEEQFGSISEDQLDRAMAMAAERFRQIGEYQMQEAAALRKEGRRRKMAKHNISVVK